MLCSVLNMQQAKANHQTYMCVLWIQVLYWYCSVSILFPYHPQSHDVLIPERSIIFSKAFQFDILHIPLSIQVSHDQPLLPYEEMCLCYNPPRVCPLLRWKISSRPGFSSSIHLHTCRLLSLVWRVSEYKVGLWQSGWRSLNQDRSASSTLSVTVASMELTFQAIYRDGLYPLGIDFVTLSCPTDISLKKVLCRQQRIM